MDNYPHTTKVVLVDDSGVIRGAIGRILESDPAVEIVGSVSNGEMAITLAKNKQPDVLILDVEMPVMDGLTALPLILKASPKTKVIMCSTLTEKGADVTIRAMSLGAVESIVKPSSTQQTGPGSAFHHNLLTLVKSLGSSPSSGEPRAPRIPVAMPARPKPPIQLRDDKMAFTGKPSILAIGSSTGGPNALFTVLKNFRDFDIPIVITQHMPATFTKILAQHIKDHTGIPTFEGEDGMTVERGKIFVAPGGKHMLFTRDGGILKIRLDDGPQENFCKPAVDPMLRSLVDIFGSRILCVILTGMGQDGMLGSKVLVEKGGRVIAQDEASSVVWGMPGAVATNGLCSAVLPLNDIGPWVVRANRGL